MRIVEAQLDLAVELKQDGSKVTGTATSEHLGVMAVDGTVANGTLSFVATGAVSGQDVKIEFSGKSGKDGALFGDLTSQMGAMTWTATRVRK
jgi:hypothetical protein